MILHETEHMLVDYLDRVWLKQSKDLRELVFLGLLCEELDWPCRRETEPHWYITEVADLYDLWTDGTRFARDCRDTARDTYRKEKL